MTAMTPTEASGQLTLQQLEDLALKHMVHDGNVVRHRGQVEVAREMRALATSNIADILYEDDAGVVRMRPLSSLPREVTAAIKKVKIKRDRVSKGDEHIDLTGEVVEIELWDKNGPLDKLMRHYGGYAEDNAQQAAANAGLNRGVDLDMLMGAIHAQGIPQPRIIEHEEQPPEPFIDRAGEEDL